MKPLIKHDDLAFEGRGKSRQQAADNNVDMMFMLFQGGHGVQWSDVATLNTMQGHICLREQIPAIHLIIQVELGVLGSIVPVSLIELSTSACPS